MDITKAWTSVCDIGLAYMNDIANEHYFKDSYRKVIGSTSLTV